MSLNSLSLQMEAYRVPEKALDLNEFYMTGRQQTVHISGTRAPPFTRQDRYPTKKLVRTAGFSNHDE